MQQGRHNAVNPMIDRRRIVSMLSSLPVIALGRSERVGAASTARGKDMATPAIARPTLFSSQSMWNATPVDPLLGDIAISPHQTPWIEEGAYASRIFFAAQDDPPMTIMGRTGGEDIQVANEGVWRSIVIPRFPADTMPATGTDGHCTIIDPVTGLMHGFWQLKKVGGQWRATKYVASPLAGTGFGTASNPDNVRASGTSAAAGMMLASERGLAVLPHALALCLDLSSFSSGPVFPATMEDYKGVHGDYTGTPGHSFKMGTLFLLPPQFDAEALHWEEARVIARTLKRHGAYLVDATRGTASLSAEIGSGWSRSSVNGVWQNSWARDVKQIFDALRAVTSVAGWLDADGAPFTPTPWGWQNILSMRGPWSAAKGMRAGGLQGRYDGAADMYLVPATSTPCGMTKHLVRRDPAQTASWRQWMTGQAFFSNPVPGAEYRLAAVGTGMIDGRLLFRNGKYQQIGATDNLSPGEERTFPWPADATVVEMQINKPAGPEASIRLELTTRDPRAAG
ncbi:hypothetical protein NUH86_07630 [Sphingobium sp. JS3065]|uniref:hypothetical protein n=1 Tax=Sphingobium sp. JS3065 TaxID=2970925 RepID=UPI00226409BE|nr:hypothetical protein [Sphingobium sp. JS3065]UZW56614.1 hypothetical protein NUH86_07630 [Sphingobium sp. JS3065]